jgi:hypothetical protein
VGNGVDRTAEVVWTGLPKLYGQDCRNYVCGQDCRNNVDRTAEITWTGLLTFLKTIRAAGREDCCSWSTDLITNINIIIIRVTIDMHPSPPEKKSIF